MFKDSGSKLKVLAYWEFGFYGCVALCDGEVGGCTLVAS